MTRATKKFTYHCNGGPYDRGKLLLTTPSTLVFTAKGMTGRYRPGKITYPSQRDRIFGVNPALVPVDYEDHFGVDLIWEEIK